MAVETATAGNLGGRLRELRTRTALGVAEFARRAGVTPDEVKAWEDGRAEVTAGQLDAATRAAGLRIRDLARPPDEWPLHPALFRATGSTSPSSLVDIGAYRTIAEFKRCVADIADLEVLLGREAQERPRLSIGWDPVPPHGAVDLAARARSLLGLHAIDPIRSMTDILETHLDVRIIAVTPDELPASVHAMSTIAPRPALLLNLLDRNPRTRYALAHELCHFLVDLDERADLVSAEAGAFEDVERRAEAFAANFLAPSAGVRALVRGEPTDERNVKDVASRFCIGRQAAINRICDVFDLPYGTSDRMTDRPRLTWEPEFEEKLPPAGLRSGHVLGRTMDALSRGLLDRVRAREILRIDATEELPSVPGVSKDLLVALRDPTSNARSAVDIWLQRQRIVDAIVSDPIPTTSGWEVQVSAGATSLRLRVSRELDVERVS